MCKIALLENYSLFSSGIKPVLAEISYFEIIEEAKTVDKFLFQLDKNRPDIIVFDIIHCPDDGVNALKKIKKRLSKIPILLIVSKDYTYCFEEYIEQGVRGFIFRDARPAELVKAINKLQNGEDYFRKNVWLLLTDFIRYHKADKSVKKNKSILTNRELSVVKLFCKGLTYKEIGSDLHISPRTVESHKKNIQTKLNVKSTAEMVKFAFNNNII
ncbi:MAG: response regulator transcription factor [Bacteroidales bacterium]|nr:response regulator transcription factor [Bacteroidales bacterium]